MGQGPRVMNREKGGGGKVGPNVNNRAARERLQETVIWSLIGSGKPSHCGWVLYSLKFESLNLPTNQKKKPIAPNPSKSPFMISHWCSRGLHKHGSLFIFFFKKKYIYIFIPFLSATWHTPSSCPIFLVFNPTSHIHIQIPNTHKLSTSSHHKFLLFNH